MKRVCALSNYNALAPYFFTRIVIVTVIKLERVCEQKRLKILVSIQEIIRNFSQTKKLFGYEQVRYIPVRTSIYSRGLNYG